MKKRTESLLRSLIIAALAVLIMVGFRTDAEAAVKPSVNAATISAAGKTTGTVQVKGKVKTKVRSKDNFYYLFEVNAYTDKLARKISFAKKSSVFTFTLNSKKNPGYALMKYALAVKTGNGSSAANYSRISPAVFVKNPEKAAIYRKAYKYPKTKKGLQSANFNEQVETNSKNCFVNLYVSTVTSGGFPVKYNGVTYYFNELWGYRNLVSSCNSKGISVTMQIMLDGAAPDDLKAANGGEGMYAFNIKNRKARMKMDAMFAYLSKIFGTDSCYVSNWVLGNEVNSTSFYWYTGSSSINVFIKNYASCFRSLYNAVRSVRASSRVFICLEHCWTMSNSESVAFPGKTVLQRFDQALKRMQKNINWNLAFHAYPANLLAPAFWTESSYLTPDSSDALIISPKNLGALTSYIRDTYGSRTRIIISEIGFNSYGISQNTQAAALALAYDIAACDPMIDAFMIRSYEDDPNDQAYGVSFGIKGKKAFNVFKYMDTTSYKKKTSAVLKSQVGSNWTSYVPGFKAGRLYKMYIE